MRADRLLSILLLLQQRRSITARELSREMGVSVRTISRDLEALSLAGVPLYAERGLGGGWRLMEDYHTDLTGMTSAELQALRLLNIPEALGTLQAGADLRSALLKLLAAAEPVGDRSAWQAQLIYLDWAEKERYPQAAAQLKLLYKAIQASQQVLLYYRYGNFVDVVQEVEPYGLVAREGLWILVYAAGRRLRGIRVRELIDVQLLERHFQREEGFDLATAWRKLQAEMAVELSFVVRLRLSPQMLTWLDVLQQKRTFRIGSSAGNAQPDEWQELELYFENFESARAELLAWGGSVEVLEPLALRLSIGDYAAQMLALYQQEQRDTSRSS